jgi:NADH dehydrogenase
MYLVGFDNRVLVFVQWMWNYVTYDRGVRLITGRTTEPSPTPTVVPTEMSTALANEPTAEREKVRISA